MFVQSIEYETKVKYCQKCGSTAHFEGSCLVTEDHKEGDQRPVNAWHLVKTPKRRPQPFKGVTEMQPKLNKFEALSTMVEELVDGDSIRGRASEKVSGSERETVQDAGKSTAGNSSQAGNALTALGSHGSKGAPDRLQIQSPLPTKGGQEHHQPAKVKRSDLNPLALHDKAQLVDKVKKRSLKHKEVNGSKKRTSPPNVNDNLEQAGGRSQEVEDLNMVGTEGGYQEGSSLEDMEVGFEEGPLQPDAMEDDKADSLATNLLVSGRGHTFAAIGIYLHTDFRIRKHLFPSLLADLNLCNIPVICMGDFNAVLNNPEKTGKPPALQACLALSSFVAQSALTEVICPATKFTWTNNRVGQDNVMSKIDRCYVSKEWMDDPETMLHLDVQPRTISDHNPILLSISQRRDQVDSAWAVDLRGCAMIKLIHKLEATRDQLKSWCKGGANNLPHLIGEIKSKIRLRQTLSERGQIEAIKQECSLKRELTKLLILEERLWRQKARIKWMMDGDLNTKFFQGIANGRRRRNKIETISHEGLILTDMPDIFSACTDYFIALLGTSHGDGSLPQSLAMGPKVTSEENADLLKSPSAAEIKWAVMKADKDFAPGPNGFGNSFFQRNWSTVHEAVAGAIRGFFQSGILVKSINKTHITLLPKERGATQVDKFWPISLCISILKFITRIMVLRMRPILSRIISKNQCAFLPGRSIQESFLLSQEIIHVFENSKKQAACVKIDLSKAYDRVNWDFLKAALRYLGFHDLWIHKVMTIVTTVKSTLLINGKEGTWFEHKRGLRQGDPLSLYIFISVMEMLTRSIHASIISKQLKIPSMGAGSFSPSSTFYADDIIFFIDGRFHNFRHLKVCLDEFLSGSGLAMNPEKSTVLPFNMVGQETLEANGEHIRAFLDRLNVQVSWPRVQAEQMDILAWKNAGNSDISREHWWSYQWKDSQLVKVHNWLRTGILWSNGINRGDTWVEINISSYYKAGSKGVAGLIRDAAGRFRHGLTCWFPNNSVWWETEVLMECFGYLANMEDTQGSIYILANDGDWKQHCRDLSDCRSYRGINPLFTTSLFSKAVFCKKWPLAEATNLLLLIPDNGLYTKWTPTINTWDPLKVSSVLS
ncbi:retrotransposable element ORF2 protein [Nymphaea thermarum]|nr:retrotransposable element ORF2 protein [Nymphaea thermarum]